MRRTVKIICDYDRTEYESVLGAQRHLQKLYSDKLTVLASDLIVSIKSTNIANHGAMTFIDESLEKFADLLKVKNELNLGIDENED